VNKYRVNEEQQTFVQVYTIHRGALYASVIFGTENKEREICVTRIRERIYPTRMGWGLGKYVKAKNKKKI